MIFYIFSASLEFYLLCHLLKSEADQASEGQIPIKHRSITNVVARIHSWPEKCHFVGTGSQQYHAVNLLF